MELQAAWGEALHDLELTITASEELKSKARLLSSCHNIIYFN